MPSIGVVDDRDADRQTLARQIERLLIDHANWDVIDVRPLDSIKDYPEWVMSNDVASLVLDERLHEDSNVTYEGSDVAAFMRGRFPTMPIYIVTAHVDDSGVTERTGDVEDVIGRSEFAVKPAPYVERFVRAGTKFYEEHRSELERLSMLSSRASAGQADTDEITELRGLQTKLGLPFAEDVTARSEWLSRQEANVAKLEELERRLRAYVEGSR